jgi:hypothetical protein
VKLWAGKPIELFLGLVGGTSTDAAVSVSGIRFYNAIPPSLQAKADQGKAILTWPIQPEGYSLEATTDLNNPAIWSAVTNASAIVDLQNTVTNDLPDGTRFYRLWRQ